MPGDTVPLTRLLWDLEQALHESRKLPTTKLLHSDLRQGLTNTGGFRRTDSQYSTEVKMILSCHVDDLMIIRASSDKDKLPACLSGSLKSNCMGEAIRYSGFTFVRIGRMEFC